MKRIKLFENFTQLDPNEIVSDIETIIYELEDKEYDIQIFYKSPLVDGLLKVAANKHLGIKNVNEIVIVPVYKKGPRTPFSDLMTKGSIAWNNILDDFRNDMMIFVNQLKDHLDYINTDKITLKEKKHVPPRYGFQITIDLTK